MFGDKGISTAGIYGHGVPKNGVVPTNDKYMGYEGVGIEMAKFFKGARKCVPVTAAETLEIFAMMEAAHESKRQKGRDGEGGGDSGKRAGNNDAEARISNMAPII